MGRRARSRTVCRSSSGSAKNTNNSLPQELVMEILLRLPAQHLWQLRFVSKTWFQLITLDTQFAQLHCDRALRSDNTLNPNPNNLALPSGKRNNDNNMLYLATDYTTCDEAIPLELLPFHQVQGGDCRYNLCGICNGLLCYSRTNIPELELYIWNPLTNHYITIPCPPIPSVVFPIINSTTFGFGFDQVTKRYKVIRGFSQDNLASVGTVPHTQVSVYVLGVSSTWRIIDEDMQYNLISSDTNIPLVNGVLHWLTTSNPVVFSLDLILAFDIKDEVFREILPPNGIDYISPLHSVELQEMGGFLCMVNLLARLKFDIWMMNEYGASSSWTKQFSVRIPEAYVPYSGLETVGIAHSGEIILKNNIQRRHNLILYDPLTNSVRNLKQFRLPYFVACTFRESIVSPRVINGAWHILMDEKT